ncbi:MAG: hypothetical protein AB1749_02010 [Pseudomonadota bacterium]
MTTTLLRARRRAGEIAFALALSLAAAAFATAARAQHTDAHVCCLRPSNPL